MQGEVIVMRRDKLENRFILEALEPRVLLSGDGISGALASTHISSAIEIVQMPASPKAGPATRRGRVVQQGGP